LGIGSVIWLAGIIALLLYAAISYLRLKKKVSTAILAVDNVYETDLIETPFVLGFFHPKIYVPVGLDAQESKYIIQHEQTHLKRRDYLFKPLAFFAAAVHWFNPLAWVAYSLMARDMELSADEYVMKQSDTDIRSAYSNSLLTLSAKRNGLLNPLAFGETGVSARIKNVLRYEKPAFWISTAAFVIVVAASVLLLGSTSGDSSNTRTDEITPNPEASYHTLIVYIDENYSENDAIALHEQIEAISNVTSATFISRQQALYGFMSRHENEHNFEGIEASWFRDKFVVYVKDTELKQQTINNLQSIQGVSVIHVSITVYDLPGELDVPADQRQANYELNMAAFIREIILKSDTIQECLVTASIPSDDLIASSTISILITTKDGDMLSEPDVQAIAEIARSLMPDIKNENIAITDSSLNLYAV